MTHSSEFINQIFDSLPPDLQHLATGHPLRMQIGRAVVYKADSTQAIPTVNLLTPEQVTQLETALCTRAGQPLSIESPISITCGSKTIFLASAKEGVAVNALSGKVLSAKLSNLTPMSSLDSTELNASSSTLSASEVLLLEMYSSNVPAPSTQWLTHQLGDLSGTALARSVQSQGATCTRNALQSIQDLSSTNIDRVLADSIVSLVKQLGQSAAQSDQIVYEAEKYRIAATGNHHELSDSNGDILFAFDHSPTQLKVTTPQTLSLSQQFEIVQTTSRLADIQSSQTLTQPTQLQRLSQLSQLSDLAPKGTHAQLQACQCQQAVKVAELLATSKMSTHTPGGSVFKGTYFQVFKTSSALRVFATAGRGEVLTRIGNQIRSRLNPSDLAQFERTAQTLRQALATPSTPTKDSKPRPTVER